VAALKAFVGAGALLWAASASAEPVDRWAGEIAGASSRFAVPQEWIRQVMRAESGGRLLLDGRPVVSSAGAMGLMQLMPGTWHDMRALLALGADPWNPHDNILAGTAYLRLMYDRFGYPGLFAAYNAGPARYAAYLAGARPLPGETHAYVAALAPARPRWSVTPPPPSGGLFALRTTPAPLVRARLPGPSPTGLFVALRGPALR
jgi:soluble lytic murein transglycosylase-like protein